MECFAPSEILIPSVATHFGKVAEALIMLDYMASVGRPLPFPFFDNEFTDDPSNPFGNIAQYRAFLIYHHSHLSASELWWLSQGGLVKIPDIMTHDPPAELNFMRLSQIR